MTFEPVRGHKGFTLIELLVVIAIIGILSAVVLASLNSARAKGVEAAVKSNIATIQTQAEMFYDDNGGYASSTVTLGGATTACNTLTSVGMFGNTTIRNAFINSNTTLATTVGARCYATANEYMVWTPLKTSGYFCVDSKGSSVSSTSASPTGTSCPQ